VSKSKKKSAWLTNLDVLKSIDLTPAAEEISGTGTARMGRRMKRTLLALHAIIGTHRDYVATYDRLAEEMVASRNTARRGVEDLCAAHLLIKTERPRAQHGQGANCFQLVWSNLRDIAYAQGLQLELPFSAATTDVAGTVAADSGRPEIPSGPCQPAGPVAPPTGPAQTPTGPAQTPTGPAQTPTGPAQTPTGPAQTPTGPAQTPTGPALRGAHARTLPSSPSDSPPPPPLREQEGGGEDFRFGFRSGPADWKTLQRRLADYGIGYARGAIAEARSHGWTVQQVQALLEAAERQTIGQVRAYGPGALYRHLCLSEPGTPIRLPTTEAYQRAVRDRELAWQQSREQAKTPVTNDWLKALEAEWGERLDSLSAAELAALFEAAELKEFQRAAAIKHARRAENRFGPSRIALLHALASQSQEQNQ
jgi:hypothetical protein